MTKVTEEFRRPIGKPIKEDIIRIEMIDRPLKHEKGEGLYEWRYMEDKFYIDLLDLEKELKALGGIFEKRYERILDRIQNFHKVYLNRRTGEVTT